jgi:hypothetical protein
MRAHVARDIPPGLPREVPPIGEVVPDEVQDGGRMVTLYGRAQSWTGHGK